MLRAQQFHVTDEVSVDVAIFLFTIDGHRVPVMSSPIQSDTHGSYIQLLVFEATPSYTYITITYFAHTVGVVQLTLIHVAT